MKVKFILILVSLLLIGLFVQQRRQHAAGFASGQADRALRQGEYKNAIDLFEKAIERKENTVASQRGLLTAYIETGRYEEAEQVADKYLKAGQPDVGTAKSYFRSDQAVLHLFRGEAQRRLGDFAGAEASFKKAIEPVDGISGTEQVRTHREAKASLGGLYNQLGRSDEARKLFQQIVDEGAGDRSRMTAPEYVTLGRALWALERYHDANEAFRAAIETDPEDAQGFIARGRLFLEKYDNPYAAELFEKALKLNPNAAEAMVGLADSKKMESPSEATELCRKARTVNPHLEEALDLLASLRMEAEEYEEALTELDKVLKWNANALETRSLRAVCYQFLNQVDKFAAETQKVLSINPHYGRLYHLLAEFGSYRARYAQSAEYNRKAIELTPNLWTSYAALGVNLMRLGDIRGGRQSLEQAFAKDPFDVRSKNTLDLLDTFTQYEELKSEHFQIMLHKREADVMREYVPELLEKAYTKLVEQYRFRPATPIRFEMYPNHADFAVRTFGLPGISASGACFGKVVVMDSPNAKELKEFNWGSTLWHELTHVFTLQATDNRIPRWFSEGLSMFEEQRAREGWGTSFKKQFIKAHRQKELLKLKDLNGGFIRPTRPDQVPVSYHQAGLIGAFIEKQYGFEKILALLEQYRNQVSTEEAFRKVLNLSPDEFDKAFFKYVEDLKLSWPDKPPEDAEALMRLTEANFDAHIKVAEAEVKKGGPEATARAIDTLTWALYINPFDQKLHETLARLYMQQNQPDKAVREYRVVLALNPVDRAKAYYDLAGALMDKGATKEAKVEVLKALEIAPNFDKAQELLLKLTEKP